MYIRKLLDDEYDEVVELIYHSVHTICCRDYTKKELDAWAPEKFDVIKFRENLSGCLNLAALDAKRIVGFISMEHSGYINRLYTHKDYQRRGIAAALLCRAEDWAVQNDIRELSLDSSKTAVGFYLKMGFENKGVSVMRHGDVIFRNTVMRKRVYNNGKAQ